MDAIPPLPTRCPTQPCYLTAAKKSSLPDFPPKRQKGIEGGCSGEGGCDKTSRCFLPPDKRNFSHCFSLMQKYLSPESLVSSLSFRELLFSLMNWCLGQAFSSLSLRLGLQSASPPFCRKAPDSLLSLLGSPPSYRV